MFPIETKHLVKHYGSVCAVNDVSFSISSGEIFGLIGPDGAGKTTLMRILVSLINSDSGDALFFGKSIADNMQFVRGNIGYMPQRFSLYQDLTVEENMAFYAKIFQVSPLEFKKRKEELYHFSKLEKFKSRRAGALSGGMKQKLALSCMLIHEPEVMILDEPTTGVDPIARHEFWEMLKALSHKGKTLLISTPYMEEAQQCTRVGLMYQGKVMAMNTPALLETEFACPLFLVKTEDAYQTYKAFQKTEFKDSVYLFGDGIHIRDPNHLSKSDFEKRLRFHEISYLGIEEIKSGLEDIFLNLTLNSR